MSMGDGGGGSAPDYGALAASNERIYERTVQEAEPWTDAGERALAQILFETNLGPQPYLSPDGSIVYEPGAAGASAPTPPPVLSPGSGGVDSDRYNMFQNARLSYNGGSEDGLMQYTLSNGQVVSSDFRDQELERLGYEMRTGGGAQQQQQQPAAVSSGGALPEGATKLGGFQATPGYDFRMQEGQRSLLAGMNAAGAGKDSGSTLKAMERYGQEYGTQEYNNYMSRLGQVAGYGQFGVATTANAGSQLQQSNLQIAGMQQSAYNQQQAQRASTLGGVGQLVGTIGGAAIGGPWGATAGSSLSGGIY